MGYSPPGSSIRGILQAKILEWVAISFSRGCSQPRDQTHISFIGRQVLFHWAPGDGFAGWLWIQSDWQSFSVDVSPLKFRRSESPPILQKASPILKQREISLPLFFGRNCLSLFDTTWYLPLSISVSTFPPASPLPSQAVYVCLHLLILYLQVLWPPSSTGSKVKETLLPLQWETKRLSRGPSSILEYKEWMEIQLDFHESLLLIMK